MLHGILPAWKCVVGVFRIGFGCCGSFLAGCGGRALFDDYESSDEWFLCMVGELQISFEFAVMSVRSAISNDEHRTLCDVRYGAKIRTKKLNDKRAFGGCLGTRRRRRTWHAAKSLGEPRAGFDPRISEWGNPSARRSSSEYIG